MTEQTTTTPAALDAELDQIIAEAELAESAIIDQPNVDATDIALQYAADYGIDIGKVKGTGKDGRITVPDVEKHKKVLDVEAEKAEAEPDQPVEEGKKGEDQPPATPKPKRKTVKGTGTKVLPSLPNVFVGMTEIYHVVRFINEYGMGGWKELVVSGPEADENLGYLLEEGFQLIHAQPLGYEEMGIGMLWVFGKFAEEKVERFPYQEIRHITQRIGGMGEDGRGISGQAANVMISGYLQAGYDLAMVEALDKGVGGVVNIMWILVR